MYDHLLYCQNANIEILCFYREEKSESIYQETNLIYLFQFYPIVLTAYKTECIACLSSI